MSTITTTSGLGKPSALPFSLTSYEEVQAVWPEVGNHILASYTKESLVLYVGCQEWVATGACATQSFKGLVYHINWTLRPGFLSAIYNTGWATRPNYEHLLALTVSREGLEKILQMSLAFKGLPNPQAKLTWEPDRSPFGDELERNVPAISLRKDVLDRLLRDWVNNIKDVTNFVRLQRKYLLDSKLNYMLVPDESPLAGLDQVLADKLGVDKPIPLVLPEYQPTKFCTTTTSSEIKDLYVPPASESEDEEFEGSYCPLTIPHYTDLDYNPNYLCSTYHHYHHVPIDNFATDTSELEDFEVGYGAHASEVGYGNHDDYEVGYGAHAYSGEAEDEVGYGKYPPEEVKKEVGYGSNHAEEVEKKKKNDTTTTTTTTEVKVVVLEEKEKDT